MNNVVNLQTFPFREVEGLQVRIKDNPTVIDFVELYLTGELFELLVTQTNLYADQFLSDKHHRNKSVR